MKSSFVSLLTLVMLSLFAISCGKAPSNVLTDIKVQSTVEDSQVWMSVAAGLNLGQMNFAAVTIPVKHPKTHEHVGQLDLIPGLNGVNQIKIGVNLTALADLKAEMAKLPNGNLVPLIANNQAITIDLGKGAKIYLILSEKVSAIAAAIPIAAFDSLGNVVGGINLFPVVNIKGVVGSAGIFTSAKAGENGIALAMDVTKFINPSDFMPSVSHMALMQAEESQDLVKLDYRSQSPSQAKKAILDRALYELNKKKAILKVK